MHRKSWHSQFCKYDVWNLRPLKATNQQSWSYHMNCCLSRRGKTVRSKNIKDIIRIRQTKALSIKVGTYDFTRPGQGPSSLWRLIKPIFFGPFCIKIELCRKFNFWNYPLQTLFKFNLWCLSQSVFLWTVWKKRRKMAVKVRRVYAFFDGLKFQQNDRCQISILSGDK